MSFRSSVGAAILVVLVSTACNDDDSVGPRSLADPQETIARLEALNALFDVQALESFSALGYNFRPVSPPFPGARALATAVNPLAHSSALRPFAGRVDDARALRRLLPALTDLSAASVFPPEVVGKTFEWNVTTDQYEPTDRAGAPADGVRFILYAVDPLAVFPVPAEPLVEVGQADLINESSGSTTALRVRVAGVGGSPVYVDYVVSLSGDQESVRLTAAGYVTSGANAPDTLRFEGAVTIGGTEASTTLSQDVTFDVNSQDIHVRLVETATVTETAASARVTFRFEHGDEIVTLEGEFELDNAAETATGTIAVQVNGGPFATCALTAGPGSFSIDCDGADGDGLTAEEEAALEAISDAIAQVTEVFAVLFTTPLGVLLLF